MRVTLTLPYPISANRYWRSFTPRGQARAIVVLSDEAKAYKTRVAWLAKAAGVRAPIEGRVEFRVQLYPARPQDWQTRQRKHGAAWDDSVRCIDLDNANKVLLDALKGVAIVDDAWVRRIVAERMEPDGGDARVVVTLTALATEQPQADLLGALA
jgi:crossover junction endodeoxyribonuclease RusA